MATHSPTPTPVANKRPTAMPFSSAQAPDCSHGLPDESLITRLATSTMNSAARSATTPVTRATGTSRHRPRGQTTPPTTALHAPATAPSTSRAAPGLAGLPKASTAEPVAPVTRGIVHSPSATRRHVGHALRQLGLAGTRRTGRGLQSGVHRSPSHLQRPSGDVAGTHRRPSQIHHLSGDSCPGDGGWFIATSLPPPGPAPVDDTVSESLSGLTGSPGRSAVARHPGPIRSTPPLWTIRRYETTWRPDRRGQLEPPSSYRRDQRIGKSIPIVGTHHPWL